jgi:membrane-bound ClpP family serine protease
VYIAELKGEVSAAQFYFLRRALKDAESGGASAFVIEMDTYGGSVNAA